MPMPGRGESTTDMVFAGHNLIAENGKLLAQTALFTNEMAITELDVYRLAAERRRTTTWPPLQRPAIPLFRSPCR